jgi:nucleoside diphosphate kinase
VNRLRIGEIRYFFEKAGFEIVNLDTKREAMPTGIRSQLKGRFAEMHKDELDVTVALFTLQKPIV